MSMIESNIFELTGKWIIMNGQIVADPTCQRIFDLIKNYLVVISHDQSGWDTLYREPNELKLWELTYPQSELQSGGPPKLQRISVNEAKMKYGDIVDDSRE